MSFVKSSILVIFILFIAIGFLLFRFGGNVFANLLTPVSIVSRVIGEDALKSSDGRTNILLLGLDKRSPSGSNSVSGILTDTIMVISIGESGSTTSVISIPRDFYVPEIDEKINALYARNCDIYDCGVYKGKGFNIERVQDKVEKILGLEIHYHVLVGFEAFTEAIDAVGGITLEVENSFIDTEYPIEGKEDVFPESDRYKTVRFVKGITDMDGNTALEFARSRHSSVAIESGDFARSRRQQKVIMALKDKILTSSTLLNPSKISDLYKVFEKNVETNISLSEALLFYTMKDNLESMSINKIVLSDEPETPNLLGSGMLYTPNQEEREQQYGGKYVLLPKDKSYESIHAMIRNALFCNESDSTCNQ